MRDFFLTLLQNLDKLSGLKQYEKICQMQNFKDEINNLLDILCRVADQFPFIPEQDKKTIINNAVITDGEFIGLNARIVYKWLNAKKDLYFTELAHMENKPENEPLTGEAREARLNEWLQALNKTEMAMTSRSDVYKTVRENWTNPTGEKYIMPTKDDLYAHDRHIEYIKRNYDAKTGGKLPDWVSEEDFNKLYDEGII